MTCPKCGLKPEHLVVIPRIGSERSGELITALMRHVVAEEIGKGNCPSCLALDYATVVVYEDGVQPLVVKK